MSGRRYSERYRDEKLENGRYRGNEKRRAHLVGIEDLFQDVALIYETLTEVETENVSEPRKVALKYRSVKTVSLIHLLNKLVAYVLSRRFELDYPLLNEVSGHTAKKHVENKRYAEKYKQRYYYSLHYVLEHYNSVL